VKSSILISRCQLYTTDFKCVTHNIHDSQAQNRDRKDCVYIRFLFAHTDAMFDPDANMPRPNRSLIYFGACIIAGLRLARERQVNTKVVPTQAAIEESVDLAHDIFYRVFRKVSKQMKGV
jgi:hypothetical protein